MDDTAFANYAATEKQKLERAWGDKFKHKLGLAQQLVSELAHKHHGITRVLSDSGAGSSAVVLNLLAGQAEVLIQRSGS